MVRKAGIIFTVLAWALFLCACSSAPRKQEDQAQKVALSPAEMAVVQKAIEAKESSKNLDIAHESFIRAQDMELRGEKKLAEVFWQRAHEADPENRFLAFTVAERLLANGNDSAALDLASKAVTYKGKASSKQYELMAKLYVRQGVADSARKYFKIALDSAHNQDMTLLYDYSLFLEAIQDKEELVKVYEALLPQTNYIQSLFNRQVGLLVELKKDSAIVELFEKAHEATGDRELLAKLVQGLAIQRRNGEVRAIADTVTGTDEIAETIVKTALLSYTDSEKDSAYAFLQKKYYKDSVVTPVTLYYLGSYEFVMEKKDSARVHLEQVYLKLDKYPSYAAQACRSLAGIAFADKKKKEGLRYAILADSLHKGGDTEFLAMAYAYANEYAGAYAVLDSAMGVLSQWTPMAGIADSSTMSAMKQTVETRHRRLQQTYAQILVMEAMEVEKDGKADSLKLAHAMECRGKAELFWESMLMADTTDLFVQVTMAMNLERMGRFDESFKMFENLLKHYGNLRVDWPEVLNYYGYSLIDENRSPEEVEKGLQLVLKALATEKGASPSEAYLDSKAWGLYRQGKYQEALETLNLIKGEHFLDDYEYLLHLGAIQDALGNKAEATKAYKKVLKLRPNNKAAKEFFGKKKK